MDQYSVIYICNYGSVFCQLYFYELHRYFHKKSNVELALCLQFVAVVDRQAKFTDTYRISSMVMALCVTVVD